MTADERVNEAREAYEALARLTQVYAGRCVRFRTLGDCHPCSVYYQRLDAASIAYDLAVAAASDERRPDFRA